MGCDRSQIRVEIEHASYTFYRRWDCSRRETPNGGEKRGAAAIVRDLERSHRTTEADSSSIGAKLDLFDAIDGAIRKKRHRGGPVVRRAIGKPQFVVFHRY
jgi:hypothetical protein